jgi:hypothetical protein
VRLSVVHLRRFPQQNEMSFRDETLRRFRRLQGLLGRGTEVRRESLLRRRKRLLRPLPELAGRKEVSLPTGISLGNFLFIKPVSVIFIS